MRDDNILSRHIKPAAQTRPALDQLASRCLRTSHAPWMVEAGANPKDVQGRATPRVSRVLQLVRCVVVVKTRPNVDKPLCF